MTAFLLGLIVGTIIGAAIALGRHDSPTPGAPDHLRHADALRRAAAYLERDEL